MGFLYSLEKATFFQEVLYQKESKLHFRWTEKN